MFDNVIYIPVSINHNPPVDFVIDTGAPQLTIIERDLIAQLNMQAKKGGTLKGAGPNSVKFVTLENVKLSLPGLEISGIRIGSHTLAHMEPYWGKPKYGMLGGNFLKRVVTEIDYTKGNITFTRPDKFIYKGSGQKIPVKLITNAILVNASIRANPGENEFVGLFLIDTGVRNSFFNSPFVKEHRILKNSKRMISNITGFGIGRFA